MRISKTVLICTGLVAIFIANKKGWIVKPEQHQQAIRKTTPKAIRIGEFSQESICQTAGLIIRQRLGNNFHTANAVCKVKALVDNQFEIDSGYQSPIAPNEIRYTAQGNITGDKLNLVRIKVHGIDSNFIPMSSFPN